MRNLAKMFGLRGLQADKPRYCIVFVTQAGELELKSLLLAASLQRRLSGNIDLVAAIPEPISVWGRPSETTIKLLHRLGVRMVPIENPIGIEYPIGNKLSALGVETKAKATIFLDSDIICMRSFDPGKFFLLPFSAKPADAATYGKNKSEWQKLYALAECRFPKRSVQTTYTKDIIAPYFNAGVLCVKNGAEFSKVWIDICQKIHKSKDIENKYPWLDQIGLPLAAAKLHYKFHCLDEQHNYPAHLRSIDSSLLPLLCHYHSPSVIAREPLLRSMVGSMVMQLPELKSYFQCRTDWNLLYDLIQQDNKTTDHSNRFNMHSKHDFFITGIPRTGTSLLCSLLHKHENCVVVNEPKAIIPLLKDDADPSAFEHFHYRLRNDILTGKSIENKISNNVMIEDTAILDRRENYSPEVSIEKFSLGTKNTLAFMARLPFLQKRMPLARTVACIRNPYHTIASWKLSFDHLRLVDTNRFPAGYTTEAFLSEEQRQQLDVVNKTENLTRKQALLWQYLATIMWDNKVNLLIVHYENLISDTDQQLSTILKYIGAENPVWSGKPDKPLCLSDKTNNLSNEDLLIIKKTCLPIARRFGYDL